TIVFTGARSQYQITQNSDGSLAIADLRSGTPDGTSTVYNSEFFQFTNQTYSFSALLATVSGIVVTGTTSQAIQGGSPVALLSGTPTITDTASTTLASATVRIANAGGSAITGDQLYINAQQSGTVNGVRVSWDNGNKILPPTGPPPLAPYQALLTQITYADAGVDPSSGTHPVRPAPWPVNDGTTPLPPATS